MSDNSNNEPWFNDRNDRQYLQLLYEKLDLDYLIESAISVPNDNRYEKIIRIDFCGIAGSTLLLHKESELHQIVKERFIKLFENAEALKKNKILLKPRFIFMYLYSDFSYAQIEAERAEYRATIRNNMYYDYNEDLPLFSLTDKEFFASQIFNNQTKALKQIQDIYNRFYRGRDSYEILNIRFSCLPLNLCQLTINNQIFIDPYSYARLDNNSPLAYETPVIHIDKTKQLKSFQILEDHFRYIWNHPTTLFYEDCTKAYFDKESSNKLDKLHDIKIPNEVNFNDKINWLKTRFFNTNDEKLNRWQFQVESMFRSMTRMIEVTPESEALFIGFSFDNGKKLADEITNFLKDDFKGCLKLNVVNLREGNDPLYPELIRQMKESTMALIFFTKDIHEIKEDKEHFYARPNLYFEIGYLLSHLSKFGSALQRIMAFTEDEKVVPSDLQDIFHFKLKNNVYIDYIEIMDRMLSINKTLTERIANIAITKMIDRLQVAHDNGFITNKDFWGKIFADFRNDVKVRLLETTSKRFRKKTDD